MPGPEIIIDITSEGSATVSTKGFPGKGCLAFAKSILDGMGRVKKIVHTSEYSEVQKVSEVVKIGK
jgi:hypothetical protein